MALAGIMADVVCHGEAIIARMIVGISRAGAGSAKRIVTVGTVWQVVG